MTKVRRIDFSSDEWLSGTARLDNACRGLYITACALIYSHGGPIEIEDLRASCRDHGHAFKRQLDCLISLGKLVVNGSQITNKRAINELQKAEERAAKARQNGEKGGRPPKENNSLAEPGGFVGEKLTINHQPSTTNYHIDSEAIASEPQAAPPDPVTDLWNRAVRVLGPKSRSLVGKMRKEYGDPAVVEAVLACEHECPSEPMGFFVGCLRRARQEKQNGRRLAPIEGIFAGAAAAIADFEREAEGDFGLSESADGPLLGTIGTCRGTA